MGENFQREQQNSKLSVGIIITSSLFYSGGDKSQGIWLTNNGIIILIIKNHFRIYYSIKYGNFC